MTRRNLIALSLLALTIEGLIALWQFLSIPGDPKNEFLFGFSLERLAFAAALLALIILFALSVFQYFYGGRFSTFISVVIEKATSTDSRFVVLLSLFALSLVPVLNWRFAPQQFEATLYRLSPLFWYSALILGHLLLLHLLSSPSSKKIRQSIILISVSLSVFFLAGTLNYLGENFKYESSDQSAYIEFAREVRLSDFRFTGSRNFMPAYPFLQALFLDPTLDTNQLFIQGKVINIALTFGILIALNSIFHRHLSSFAAYLLTLVLALSLFVYKAAYYQPEVLFYFLFFLTFLMMSQLIVKPNWKTAILLGLIAGLAHLTKASLLPALLLFAAIYILIILLKQFGYSGIEQNQKSDNGNSARVYLANLALVFLVFLGTVFPYVRESKETYGQYFYNVNTTFYVWYDTWRQATEGTRAHGDAVGWPQMPAEDIPSLLNYLRDHTYSDIMARLGKGLSSQLVNIWDQFSWLSYPLVFLLLLSLAARRLWNKVKGLLRVYWPLITFVLLFVVGYLLLYAWYGPIADYSDMRFTHSLYIPILFSSFVALEKLVAGENEIIGTRATKATAASWLNAAYGLVALLLTYEIVFQIPEKLTRFDWYGK